MRVRKLREPRGWAIAFAATVLKPILFAVTKRRWIDGEKLPAEGGCIVVPNHISHVDPLLTAHFVYDHGRLPRYLAKSALFQVFFVKTVLKSAQQIPVERLSRNAVGAFDAAVKAVEAGECVIVYPEGTLTRDPDLWPMKAKSGAARIALATGAPVIPLAHWGAQDLLYPYAKKPKLFPRTKVVLKAGDPVPLEDLRAKPQNQHVINEATDRIMAHLTALVGDLRGEEPPLSVFDSRAAGVLEIGNPHSTKRHRKPTHKKEGR